MKEQNITKNEDWDPLPSPSMMNFKASSPPAHCFLCTIFRKGATGEEAKTKKGPSSISKGLFWRREG